jgi:porin
MAHQQVNVRGVGPCRPLTLGLLAGVLGYAPGLTQPALCQEEGGEAGATEAAPVAEPEPASQENDYLLGDWRGARHRLTGCGVTLDLQWTHYGQGVLDGGQETGWQYGATAEVLTTLDLGKLKLVPGGFFTFRAEGRYGESVIAEAGTVLPVNTDLYMPVTSELDDDILTITELSYTQFLSDNFALFGGKLQTLDGDPNEFASGRGRSQFMNFNLVAPNLMGLAVPYSNLGAGVLFLPTDRITISTLLMNTAEASTTSGFDDFGDGTSWLTEAQFQYRLGDLPGGQNVGFAYAFDNDFLRVNRPGLPGGGVLETTDDTWTLYWSAWQYFFTLDEAPDVLNAGDGRPDVRGLGLFARASIVDEDTSVVRWGGAVGIGGRGIIPTRDEDVFGVGFVYTDFNRDGPLVQLLAEEEAYGAELFYNAKLWRGLFLTGDLQVIEPATRAVDTTVVAGIRVNLRF